MASQDPAQLVVGIIGVGEIARAIVVGLSEGNPSAPVIKLSPRGARVAAELANHYPNVTVSSSNADAAEACDVLILAVRPDQAKDALAGVKVGAETVLLSVVAGLQLASLAGLVGTPGAIIRAIPLPSVASRTSVTVIHPGHRVVESLFEGLGGTLTIPDESGFATLSAVTGTISTHLRYLASVADWAAENGIEYGVADDYVRGLFSDVGAALDKGRPLTALVHEYETPGGINEQLSTTWLNASNVAALQAGLDALRSRVE